MNCIHTQNKLIFEGFRAAQYNFELADLKRSVNDIFHPEALIQLCYPFETMVDPNALVEQAYKPLVDAIPDLERRDTIVMAGQANNGDSQWLGACGYYTGVFKRPWLGIPPTGHMVSMRFHEFYRFSNGKIIEMQSVWDIPEVMMQANVWPMVPSLGREWHVPGPATQDGIVRLEADEEKSKASMSLVNDMCDALGNYATGGVEAMRLADYWHPRCSWYGPSGIGTGRGIEGFRNWHQIPFLNGLPDRVGDANKGYLFADQDYVAFTAWPGMYMTVGGDGWLGIAPSKQKISMRSLDFWRCENGLIRENWVLIDLLDVYHQLGVDVFARMAELTKAKIF
jgi:predicted ester cyclase